MAGVTKLIPNLEKMAKEALDDLEPDNPIYRAAKNKVMKELHPKNDFQSYILERLDRFESILQKNNTKPLSVSSARYKEKLEYPYIFRCQLKEKLNNVSFTKLMNSISSLTSIQNSEYKNDSDQITFYLQSMEELIELKEFAENSKMFSILSAT